MPRRAQHAGIRGRRRRSSPTCCRWRSPGAAARATSSCPPPTCRASSPRRRRVTCAARGGSVRTETRAQVVGADRDGGDARWRRISVHVARAAIVAVGPHQLAQAFAPEALARIPTLAAAIDALGALAYEPIVTIWLGYPSARRHAGPDRAARRRAGPMGARPARRPRARDAGRGIAQLLAVVISAGGPHMALTHDDARARRRRAVAAAAPGAARVRLVAGDRGEARDLRVHAGARAARGPAPRAGLYLAGDYVDDRVSGDARGRGAQRHRGGGGMLADR